MDRSQAVSDQDFEKAVLNSNVPVLVEFWAQWCEPCHVMEPTLDEIAAERGESLSVVKLNIDENPITAQRFGVRTIPAMILFRNGHEADRVVGTAAKKTLESMLQRHIA